MPPRLDPVESLVLEILRKSKLFIETEFLVLAQALEGFHRATMNTPPTQRALLRTIREAVGNTLDSLAIQPDLKERISTSISHADDPNLATRLTALCNMFSPEFLSKMQIDPATFISNVMGTRNYYTHLGGSEKPKKKPLNGKAMFLLNQKMRALLRGVMLLHVGLAEETMIEVLPRQATKWRASS